MFKKSIVSDAADGEAVGFVVKIVFIHAAVIGVEIAVPGMGAVDLCGRPEDGAETAVRKYPGVVPVARRQCREPSVVCGVCVW